MATLQQPTCRREGGRTALPLGPHCRCSPRRTRMDPYENSRRPTTAADRDSGSKLHFRALPTALPTNEWRGQIQIGAAADRDGSAVADQNRIRRRLNQSMTLTTNSKQQGKKKKKKEFVFSKKKKNKTSRDQENKKNKKRTKQQGQNKQGTKAKETLLFVAKKKVQKIKLKTFFFLRFLVVF